VKDVKLGQVWTDPEGNTWSVVGFEANPKGDKVSLSGPRPCRGMKKISVAKLRREWSWLKER
jgi:hypothetical protein